MRDIYGYDSLIINFTLYHYPSVAIFNYADTICNGDALNFNGNLLTVAGVYYDTLQSSAFGCDSLICLTLTVNNVTPISGVSLTKVNSSFVVTWQANAALYKIYRNNNLLTTVNTAIYIDNDLTNGEIYCYKIKAVDKDCESEFSTEVCETFNNVGIVGANGNSPALRIYPNPTNGQLIIEISDIEHQISEIQIFDVMGQLLQSKIVNLKSKIEFDISHLATGIYFLRVDNRVVKVIKN